ncbi:DNA-binding transcriptional regulator, HxlR family [Amycolatopsis xylanica]|uniref:DNA-binding transcriptional regulator, HxlR family n=1 Tax=Amycolatopsis xylanica TaxID=589385 RepID=A0A1H3H2B8_9PSEU|nr:helix-turn-helix domain-containing protein [Amycolatopsis xylanica]SDY09723.1 DNA-binding transcriptional regulator, HxlR family [Amycolatopsis xylanica]
MVKRTSHEDSTCAVARPLDVIGDGWSLLIIRDAFDGLRRFGQFQKSLGLAKNILSTRLQSLVSHGILRTVPAEDGSRHHDYLLTEKGLGLFPVLVALRQWGDEFFFDPKETRARLVDRERREPVAKVEVRSADGRLLSQEDTVIEMRTATG